MRLASFTPVTCHLSPVTCHLSQANPNSFREFRNPRQNSCSAATMGRSIPYSAPIRRHTLRLIALLHSRFGLVHERIYQPEKRG